MPFACIFVPNFPVAAVFRAEPELRPQAVAIFEGKPPLEKVFAVNESAGRMGIAPGMTKAQAELVFGVDAAPAFSVAGSLVARRSAGLCAIVLAVHRRCRSRHGACRSRRHGISFRIAARNCSCHVSSHYRPRARSQCCRSFESRRCRARRPRIFRRDRDSTGERRRVSGISAGGSFVCRLE